MKYYIPTLVLLLLTLTTTAQDLFEFTSQYGSGSVFIDEAEDIVMDSEGNIILFGSFEEEVDFDLGEGETLIEPLGFPDLFVAKYMADGTLMWVNSIGRLALNNGIFAENLVVDDSDNVIITGGFTNTVDFDPSEEVNSLVSNGGSDAFIAKYDPNGNYISALGIGGLGSDLITALAIDGENNLYCGLRFNNEVDVDPGDEESILIPTGASDAAMIKYASDNSYTFSHQIGTSGNDQLTSIELSPSGEIVLGAFTNGTTSGIPQQELFVEVLSSEAVSLWQYGFSNPATNNSISCFGFSQDQNSLYISGRFQASTDFDPSLEEDFILNPQFADVFFAKYDLLDGSFLWAKQILGSGVEDYSAAVVEAGQAFMIAGSFENSAFFEPGDFTTQVSSEGGGDVFLAAYNPETGDFISVQTFGGDGLERAVTGDFNQNGQLALAGRFSGNLSLNPSGDDPLQAQGFLDFFFALFEYDMDLSSPVQLTQDMIKVFPVPAQNSIGFTMPDEFMKAPINIRVISVVGQVVREYSFNKSSSNKSIDISSLNTGIYLVEFDLGYQSFTKRIVKN